MTKKQILIVAVLALLLVVLGTAAFKIYGSVLVSGISGLDRSCRSAPVEEGIRTVKLKRSLRLVNQRGTLTQPCRIKLQRNVSFEINHSEISSDKLAIVAQDSDSHNNELRISYSKLSSQKGGLLIRLQTKNSQVFIDESKFDYPLSIVISAGADEDSSKALLMAKNNIFKSVSGNSRGIGLISTGDGQYYGNRFELLNKDDFAYVVAVRCQAANNINSSPRCQLN